MSRPLVITDCDEVLLHMVAHFRDWLDEEEGIAFTMGHADFARSMRRKDTGEALDPKAIWSLLGRFFDGQMHRQTTVPGAVGAIAALREEADVVVLTNLQDHRREDRARQLAGHGIELDIFTNQGPKGPALQAILERYRPSCAVFIDDLAVHHDSVAGISPEVTRLHLCAEAAIAPHIPCAHKAGHAHARIDEWDAALPWLLARLRGESPTREKDDQPK